MCVCYNTASREGENCICGASIFSGNHFRGGTRRPPEQCSRGRQSGRLLKRRRALDPLSAASHVSHPSISPFLHRSVHPFITRRTTHRSQICHIWILRHHDEMRFQISNLLHILSPFLSPAALLHTCCFLKSHRCVLMNETSAPFEPDLILTLCSRPGDGNLNWFFWIGHFKHDFKDET